MWIKIAVSLLLACVLCFGAMSISAETAENDAADLWDFAAYYMNSIPEEAYGGMYYDEDGQLIVNIKEGCDVDIAVPISGNVEVRTVAYSLAELEAMKDAFEPYMEEYHILTLDADEVNNVVAIEVTRDDSRIYELIESLENVVASIVEVTVLPEDYTIELTVQHCDTIQ